MSETDGQEESWSDRLKRALKPQWMVERDKRRAAGKDDWRFGHLLWLATVGSPTEIDGFSKQVDRALARKGRAPEVIWQKRESNERAYKSAKETEGRWER